MDGLETEKIKMETGNFPQLFRRMMLTKLRQSLCAVQLSPQFLPSGVRDQALHILSYALEEDALDSEAAWQLTRDLLLELAPRMELMGHRYDWIPFLEKGIETAKKFGEAAKVAEYQFQLGTIYRLLSRFDEAKTLIQASIENFSPVDDKDEVARSLNELAWVEHLAHNYDLADMYANRALQILDKDVPERGMSYRALGMVAYYLGKLNDAEDYHRQALIIFEAEGNQRKIAWTLQNIAMSLRQQSRFEEAISYFSRSVTLLESVNDESRWSMTHIGLGVTYYHAGNLPLAIECYLRAHPVAERLHDKLQLAMIQGNIALVYFSQADYERAIQYFVSAIELYNQIGDTVWALYNTEGLASCYIKQKKYNEAFDILLKTRLALPQITASPHYESLSQLVESHLEFLRSAEVAMGNNNYELSG